MKMLCLAVLLVLATALTAEAQVRVRGYYRSNGTYVQPYYRSYPNSTQWDNWSTVGNLNPYTGQWGTRWPSYSQYRSYASYRAYYRPGCYTYRWGW
jgi:hypothetical protein